MRLRLPRWTSKPSPELENVRAMRADAERTLEVDKQTVIVPLRQIRQRNHVYATIRDLIQQHEEGGEPDAAGPGAH